MLWLVGAGVGNSTSVSTEEKGEKEGVSSMWTCIVVDCLNYCAAVRINVILQLVCSLDAW